MKPVKCPDCGGRLRKLGLENIYACDNHFPAHLPKGTDTTRYYTYYQPKPILALCTRNGYILKEK